MRLRASSWTTLLSSLGFRRSRQGRRMRTPRLRAVEHLERREMLSVNMSINDVSIEEGGSAQFTVSLSEAAGSNVTVNYATAMNTAMPMMDFTAASGSLTFQAGETLKTVSVQTTNDTLVESTESFFLNLSAASGATLVDSQGVGTILDNDGLPTVTIAATDGNAAELGQDPGTLTVTRTGATTAALTVQYTLGGTAANGADYASLGNSVTIPVGASSAAITVAPINDSLVESNETVQVTLGTGSGYNVGGASTATVTIADNDVLPTLTIVASDDTAAEAGSATGAFTITRSGAEVASPLTVSLSVGGTASNGQDYAVLPINVTIAAGAATASLTVTPVDDTEIEGSETVQIQLNSSSGYVLGSPATATVTIVDNDLPVVSVTSLDADAAEDGPEAGSFIITRTGSTTQALAVSYVLSGTASNGDDYGSLSGEVTLGAGASAVTLDVTPLADALLEGTESVILTLSTGPAYELGAASSALVEIRDANLPPEAEDDEYAALRSVPLMVASGSGVLANDADPNGDALTTTLVDVPAHGTVQLQADGGFTYTPDAGYVGADAFTYRVSDGTAIGNVATVAIVVSNSSPTGAGDEYEVTHDRPLTVAAAGVLANDLDVNGDTLIAQLIADVAHGVLSLSADGGFTYTPQAGFHGTDGFS